MAKDTAIKSSQDKTITEDRQTVSTGQGNTYKLPEGKKYLRIALDANIVDALTETHGTGKQVEPTHEEWQAEIFQPLFDALNVDEVSQDRLDGKHGHLADKVEGIREEYRSRTDSNGKHTGREISANKAFDVLVKWYNNKG